MADGEAIRVLIVEDRPTDAELMVLRLEDEGFAPAWERVESETEYLAAIAAAPDVILSDWDLPRFSGLRALAILRTRDMDIPFVIVSGKVGEEIAVEALHAGADDYVLKDRLARLGQAVRRAIDRKHMRDERRLAETRQQLAATVFESSTEGVTITDAAGSILTVNRAFEEITGYAAHEVVGRNPRMLQSGRQDENFYRDMWATIEATGRWRGELWNRRRDGRIYPEWMTISAVRDADGVTTNYVGVFTDIGDIKAAQEDIDFLVHHDALTGLPNRTLLLDRLGQAMRRAAASGTGAAVLSLDLDGFGAINDAHGHLVGDALLMAAATRLGDAVGASGSLCRSGADEFAIVIDDAPDVARVADLARMVQDAVAEPFRIDDHVIVITCTVGVSMYPGDGSDPRTLARQAEAAMRRAKAGSRAAVAFFEEGQTVAIEERLHLARDLHGAAARGELILHYQPLVRFSDGMLVGAEALVRWNHPERGVVPPGLFIPLAEEIGVIEEIGSWVLCEACHQLQTWDAAGLRLPRVSVNLSAYQLDHGDLVARISEALESAGIGHERLELEVTESLVMGQPHRAAAMLADVHALGVDVAMDDFGTGHSSLSQLKRLPLRRLKIDMSFVRDIGVDPTGEAIIRATIGLARSLDLETTAEGIEEEAQAEFLRVAGCDVAQGYLFGRPVPAAEFLALHAPGGLPS